MTLKLVTWVEYWFLDTEVDGSNPSYISVVSSSKIFNPDCLSRLSCEMSIRRQHPREVCLFSAMSFLEKIARKNQPILY